MKFERKFLEGFSEVTASCGLNPVQAHSLLMKEAKFGTLGKILTGTALGGAGLAFLNRENIHKGITNLNTGMRDYHAESIYGENTQPAPQPAVPHYTTWGREPITNNQWGTSFNTSPISTTQQGVGRNVINPVATFSDPYQAARISRDRDFNKELASLNARKMEEYNAALEKDQNYLTQPGIIRKLPLIGSWYDNRVARRYEENKNKLSVATQQRDQYQNWYDYNKEELNKLRQ